MKIAIDLTALTFNFSGVERFAINISTQIIHQDRRDEIYLLFCNQVPSAYTELIKKYSNVHVLLVHSGRRKLEKLFLFQYKVLKAMKSINADRYIFLAFAPPILFSQAGIISTFHDIGYFDCPSMWKWYVTLYGKIKLYTAMHHSDKIVCVSKFTYNRLVKKFGLSEEKLEIVYNAYDKRFNRTIIDTDETIHVQAKYHLPSESYLLCLATLEPRKNLELLVKAYDILHQKKQISQKLVLAGRKGWKMDHLIDQMDKDSVKDIVFTGFVDDQDLPAIYKLADRFIFPSRYEGFGIPPLEAIACGTQTLVSDLPVFKEALGDAVDYFKSENIDSLMKKMLENKKIDPDIMAAQAEKYGWEKSAEKYLKIIHADMCEAVKSAKE